MGGVAIATYVLFMFLQYSTYAVLIVIISKDPNLYFFRFVKF
jgi:hypothetical protein